VAELDDQEVAGSDHFEDGVEAPLVDEALRTAAVHRMVGDRDVLAEEERERHAPPGLRGGVGILLGGGGVAGDMEGATPPTRVGRGGCRRGGGEG
jgi:hypothetical protein